MSGLGSGEGGLRALEPVDGDQYGLRFLATGEHDGTAEEAHLGDDLGHVRAGVRDAHLAKLHLTHATRIHNRFNVMSVASVALYNSGVRRGPTSSISKPP